MDVIERFNNLWSTRHILEKELKKETEIQKELFDEIQLTEKVQEVLNLVREQCVILVQEKFEKIQNLALQDIINDREYKFSLDIVPRRGKPNVDLFIDKRYGDSYLRAKLNNSGDGVKSVLRIASTICLNIMSNRRKVLFFDEEMTAISKDHQENNYLVNSMNWIKKICNEFEIQLIFITHEEFLKDFADQTIVVKALENGSAQIQIDNRKTTEITNE